MNRIIISIAVLALAAAAGVAGTRAFFSDTVASQANAFAAGKVVLSLASSQDGGAFMGVDENEALFNFSGLYPGKSGRVDVRAEVEGSSAYLCSAVNLSQDLENTIVNPEAEAGDTTEGVGELDTHLELLVLDGAGNPLGEPMTIEEYSSGGVGTIADSTNGGPISPGAGGAAEYTLRYCFGEFGEAGNCTAAPNAFDNIYNDAQTDSLEGSIEFVAVQETPDNTGMFQCANLVGEERQVLSSEGFEGATFPPAGFTTSGDALFVRATDFAHSDSGSAAAGDIADDEMSQLTYSFTTETNAQLSFWWRVSSEPGFDFLRYCLDETVCHSGTEDGSINGFVDWTKVTVPVSSGSHTITWVYEKDGSISDPVDRAWIDDVELVK